MGHLKAPIPPRPSVRVMSAPSIARARPHVIGSICRLAGVMPAPNPHSDRPGFDRLDRSCHECRLTSDAAHLLVSAVVVTFSLRYVRASCMLSLSSRSDHVSKRSGALCHASAERFSSHVPPAAMRARLGTEQAKYRVP